MIDGEGLVLALAVGPTKFVAGPLAFQVDLVVSCDLIEFYTYLVVDQGELCSLIRLAIFYLFTTIRTAEFIEGGYVPPYYIALVLPWSSSRGFAFASTRCSTDKQLSCESAVFPMPNSWNF